MNEILDSPLFQALFNAPVPRIIVKADAPFFTIVTSNDAHKQVTNLVGRSISGKSVWEIFDPNESGGNGGVLLSEALTKAQNTNKTVLMPPFRYDMGTLDGSGMVEKWWQLEIMPIGGNALAPQFLLTTTNDITDRMTREKETQDSRRLLESLVSERTAGLAESELKYKSVIENSPVALALLLGSDYKVDAVNRQMLRLWNAIALSDERRLTVFKGRKLLDIFPEIRKHLPVLDMVLTTGQSTNYSEVAYSIMVKGRSVQQYAEITISPVTSDNSEVSGIIVSIHDITAQVNARKELEKAYEQIKLSKEAAQLGTFDMDLVAGSMEWDERCRELFGISHNQSVTYEHDFLAGLHPDDRRRIDPLIADLFNSEISDGNYDVEYRTIGSEDKKLRWVRAKGKVYFNSERKPVRFIGSVLEITDQKHEEQLRKDFIAMTSHELKTPLTSLQASVQLLQNQSSDTGGTLTPAILKHAEKQVIKMGKMIDGFLNLSRLESGNLVLDITAVSISDLIKEAISEVKAIYPDARFETDCQDITIQADKERLEHVLLNLLTNAIKYASSDKVVNIQAFKDGDMLTVRIRDQGIGIKKSDISRLFERFYRVMNPNAQFVAGFGIGLYLSKEIILLHKGKIWVESVLGEGSTFSFSIPAL